MVLTAAWRWFLSRSQAATTWQSLSLRNSPVLPGPCIPQPTTPRVTRSEGAAFASCPNALAGIMVGAAIASPVAARKRRRFIPILREGLFIAIYTSHKSGRLDIQFRVKTGGLPQGLIKTTHIGGF